MKVVRLWSASVLVALALSGCQTELELTQKTFVCRSSAECTDADADDGRNVGPLPDGELVVTTGLDFSCAFMPDGDAYCWGDNEDLQLGFSKDIASEVDAPNTPVAGSHTFRQLALGRFHTCGVSTGADPQVYCWGGNRHAQLGNGGASDGTSEPLRVRF